MKVNKVSHNHREFPLALKSIPSAPKALYTLGNINELNNRKVVSVVGSRAVTPYGKQVTSKLAGQLAGKGIAIASGLALGVDALAHHAALEAGGYTVAVLPSPVLQVYPATNRQLAKRILQQGGGLISEYGDDDRSEAFKGRFIERNRLVSGLADVLLITEAGERSGTLHTANFALEQGRTVMVVPGNITSPASQGCNNLIKAGALPVTDVNDVLAQLGITDKAMQQQLLGINQAETAILDILKAGVSDATLIQPASKLDTVQFNQTLTMLEISGKIKPLGNNHWSLS